MKIFSVRYGFLGIIVAGFLEGILLPLPMEVVSLPIYLAYPDKAILLALVLIICSMIGSMLGYGISKTFGSYFEKKLDKFAGFKKLKEWYDRNTFMTLLTSAVTPIPFEIYVMSAGFLQVGFGKFVLGALVSRVIRHLPQGILICLGMNIKNGREIFGIVVVAIVFVAYFIIKKVRKAYSYE